MKTMIQKIGSWFFILMMLSGLVIIFSPNSLASPTTFTEYFDTTGVGNQVSSSWLDTLEDPNYASGHFHVVNDQGGNNQFQIGKRTTGAMGWFNHTYDATKYITNYSFNYYSEGVDSSTMPLTITFNDSDGNTIVKLYFFHNSGIGATYNIYYFGHSLGQTIITDAARLDKNWTQISWEIVNSTEIRYSAGRFSKLSNGLIDVDYNSLNYRITSVYSTSVPVGGTGDGTKLLDNLSIITDYNTTGNTTINVYNESSPSAAIPDWSLVIYDDNNAIQYSEHNLDNPVSLAHTVYGTGGKYFQINVTGYNSRTYYADIRNGVDYILDVFLPPSDDSNLYYIQTINEYGQVISGVEITIAKQLNGTIKEIASSFTNAFGMYSLYLIGGDNYKINITAEGYTPLVMNDLVADPNSYGIDNPIIYTLGLSTTYYLNETMYNENIFFTAEISGDTLFVNYSDLLTNTTDTSIVITEINNSDGNYTPVMWDNRTGDDSFQITDVINSSNCYQVTLFLNHTNFGFIIETLIVCGDDLTYRDLTTSTIFDAMFDANYGTNPFGWSNTFGFFIMVACLFSFGQLNSGVSLLILGFVLLFINGVIGLALIAVTVPILFIFLGIMVMWSSHRRVPA